MPVNNPRKCFLIACETRGCGRTQLLDTAMLRYAIAHARVVGWAVRGGYWRCPACAGSSSPTSAKTQEQQDSGESGEEATR